MDEVILAEVYQTGTAVLDFMLNRTICDDLELRLGNGVKGLKQKVSLLGCCDILLSTSVMNVGIGGSLSDGGMESCSWEGGVGV